MPGQIGPLQATLNELSVMFKRFVPCAYGPTWYLWNLIIIITLYGNDQKDSL